ncbi:MAG: hypothetical protein K0R19_2438 [Bacillota bacterium]|jgi:hypothetical protein|nr:hypothetical protein [Bacillota bacterium]
MRLDAKSLNFAPVTFFVPGVKQAGSTACAHSIIHLKELVGGHNESINCQ